VNQGSAVPPGCPTSSKACANISQAAILAAGLASLH